MTAAEVLPAQAAWDACLATPDWDRAPVWIHGDLQPGNLTTNGNRLAAVIDFGALGIGDPAPDVAPAPWTFTGAARDVYRHTFPRMAEHGRRMVRAAIAELT